MDKIIKILETIKPGMDFINNDHLIEDGVLDSLEIVAIITEIEKAYEIELPPDQIDPDNFQSVRAIWQMIRSIKDS